MTKFGTFLIISTILKYGFFLDSHNVIKLFDFELNGYLNKFENSTAGVLTFNSVHPRWSYVKVDNNNFVIESAEKKPISRSAIAGFFYFKKGSIFVQYAKEVIKKEIQINEKFYISLSNTG